MWQISARLVGPSGARFFTSTCCRSSVVEHSIGNGEVDSSILSGSTSYLIETSRASCICRDLSCFCATKRVHKFREVMAAKVRYLIERDGRYHARIVVAKRLRPILKKVELSVALGADRREALRKLPRAVAQFQEQIAEAERRLSESEHATATPIAFDAVRAARALYDNSVAFDSELRDATSLYARFGHPDEAYIEDLKSIAAGRLRDDEMPRIFLTNIRQHVPAGLDPAAWRRATRILAQAELAAMEVSALRNDGEPDPPTPEFLNAVAPREARSGVSIREIFDGYRIELQRSGRGRDAEGRWAPIVDHLVNYVGHDAAGRITRRDAVKWTDNLLETLSPKTVRDSYLATARAAFAWAVDKLDLAQNPFSGVRVRLTKRVRSREKGFRLDEAQAILKAARNYAGSAKELPATTAAKRWVPLLGAYTGARVGELCQLRAEDVRQEDGIHYIRITPEAGTVKSGLFRDVPLHDHVLDEGFLDFVKVIGSGPLFYRLGTRRGKISPAEVVAGRLGKWVRTLGVIPEEVQPSHAWRHRMKTVGRELGVDPRVLDAIQGHASRTAGDEYGDVTLKAKEALIKRLPRYEIR